MLKTLDILIGAVMVLLLFSMAVTVITQGGVTNRLQQRGEHLLSGLTSLLQQLVISSKALAAQIAEAVLKHPALTAVEGKLATGWALSGPRPLEASSCSFDLGVTDELTRGGRSQ